MTLENAVRVFAGTMVLVSVILTVFVHSNFIWFTVFIGVNLIQSAYMGICPAAYFLKKFGFR
ncbi:YgaP family membrane protein [Vibrio parahaemolyticus]|uniref:YgaP family membrane protein n=1 Tax=Vibrio parahaemolyticus TaxID=670 RepID=UPI00387AF228